MAEQDEFRLTDDQYAVAKEVREEIAAWSVGFALALEGAGLGPRQAANVVTHYLVRIGAALSFNAAIEDGDEPDRSRWRAATDRAFEICEENRRG